MRRKKYPQAIANWPVEERPREKLLFKGPDSLSNAELFAIFLRVGVKERIARETQNTVLARVALRNKAKQISQDVEGITEAREEEKELLDTM
jgi:DNA repair protein RadC